MNWYGLIGYPLGHSFSKEYFTAKFKEEGLHDCSFEAFPIPSIEKFSELLTDNPGLKGLSVTIPYKESVLAYVDKLSDEVKSIGATNSIRINEGKLTAYNTDIVGFEKSFKEFLQPHQTKALVLGNGGASKAVQYVLEKMGIDFLVVVRTAVQKDKFIHYDAIDETMIENHLIIINCTPLGMHPNNDVCPPIPYDYLTSSHYLYDLVYKPAKTLFLQKGEEKGATIKNGYDMLLIQAEASWEIWNRD